MYILLIVRVHQSFSQVYERSLSNCRRGGNKGIEIVSLPGNFETMLTALYGQVIRSIFHDNAGEIARLQCSIGVVEISLL